MDKLTFRYKEVGQNSVDLDVYAPLLPPNSGETCPTVPAVVFFHGGGLAVGNRRSWFPRWLHNRVTSSGVVFISADYRLIPPSTAHDIVEDIRDLFKFLVHKLNPLLRSHLSSSTQSPVQSFQIDPTSLAVAGQSAGGLCAYLSAIHAEPKPKALLALYAMGGDFLIPHYFVPKSGVFFRGREVLDPHDFTEYLYPQSTQLQPTSESHLAYHNADYHIPGFPANPRMLLPRLYLQMGVYLDYYTGEHEPSLSLRLREAAERGAGSSNLEECIPLEVKPLFPHLNVDASWPPMFLVHGSADTAVPVQESHNMARLLKEVGVDVELRVLDGLEHSLDDRPDAEESFGGLFGEVKEFLVRTLKTQMRRA